MHVWNYPDLHVWIQKGCVSDITHVDVLYCMRSKLFNLPDEIGLLRALRVFRCARNGLVKLPESVYQLKNLTDLDVDRNNITELSDFKGFVSLEMFTCVGNLLASLPADIGSCTKLSRIICCLNQIQTLPPSIGNLVNLTSLDISSNKLTCFPKEIGLLTSLKELYCGANLITELPEEFGNLTRLVYLYIQQNHLTNLPTWIDRLVMLETLKCSSNRITFIPAEFGRLARLRRFICNYNRITVFPMELCNLHLTEFNYSNNLLEYIPPNIERFINRLKHAQGVYKDTQSVHNSGIQASITASIHNIISIPPVFTLEQVFSSILSDEILTPQTKEALVEYSKDKSVHSLLNLTFSELLLAVWNRILSFDENLSKEIKNTLNTEMSDALCKCFTGRISRLVNCLNGYDELVKITISDNEQIGTIISIAKAQTTNVDDHKKLVVKRLTELGYPENVITEWTSYIEDE